MTSSTASLTTEGGGINGADGLERRDGPHVLPNGLHKVLPHTASSSGYHDISHTSPQWARQTKRQVKRQMKR